MSRSRERVCLEDGQRLDINRLLRDGTMPRAMDGEKAGSLRVRYPEIGFEQEIRFTSRPRYFGGRQFFFECPATGRRCYVLWRPHGAKQFACRQAWGRQVAYRSQFAEPTSRAHLAKMKIQQRLSDKEWADLLPARPKRMRLRTYAKWEAKWEEQERKLDNALMLAWQTRWSVLKALI